MNTIEYRREEYKCQRCGGKFQDGKFLLHSKSDQEIGSWFESLTRNNIHGKIESIGGRTFISAHYSDNVFHHCPDGGTGISTFIGLGPIHQVDSDIPKVASIGKFIMGELWVHGIFTKEQISNLCDDELLRMRGIGKGRLKIIRSLCCLTN